MVIMISSIPGRMRIKHPSLRDSQLLAQAVDLLWQPGQGVTGVEGNRRAHCLVIHYDVRYTTPEQIMKRLKTLPVFMDFAELHPKTSEASIVSAQLASQVALPAVGSSPEVRPESSASRVPRRSGAFRVKKTVNRLAKAGMLSSLALTMGSVLWRQRGWKYWHTHAGWSFVVFAVLHIYVFRRQLLN